MSQTATQAPDAKAQDAAVRPWLGEHACVQVRKKFIDRLVALAPALSEAVRNFYGPFLMQLFPPLLGRDLDAATASLMAHLMPAASYDELFTIFVAQSDEFFEKAQLT